MVTIPVVKPSSWQPHSGKTTVNKLPVLCYTGLGIALLLILWFSASLRPGKALHRSPELLGPTGQTLLLHTSHCPRSAWPHPGTCNTSKSASGPSRLGTVAQGLTRTAHAFTISLLCSLYCCRWQAAGVP